MKLFLINLFKIIAVFIVLTIIQFFLFKVLLTNNVSFEVSKAKTILILGDSQTETSLNDSIIKNSINLSKAGDPLFFNYVKLKTIIKNNTHIKTVVLGFSPSNLDSKGFYEVPKMKSKYINYFYLIEYIDCIDIINSNSEGFIRGVTGLGKYWLNFNEIISGKGIEEMKVGGFRAIPYGFSELSEDIKNDIEETKSNPDTISIKYFYKIADFCEVNDLNLIVLNTPVHESLIKRSRLRKKGYNTFLKKINPKIVLWDFEHFKIEDKYYFDNNHLNYKGAEIFSKYIHKELNKFNVSDKGTR
jgi:hypothetical protein